MKLLFLKLITLSALILSLNIGVADTNAKTSLSSANVYLGLEGGYDYSSFKLHLNGYISDATNYGAKGSVYGIFLGYQSSAWKQFNLAVETFVDRDYVSGSDSSWTTDPDFNHSFTWNKNWEYGLSLLPGYLVSDNSKIYARIGYTKAYFKSYFDNHYSFSEPGLQLGLGYLLNFSEHLGARVEYDYTTYSNYTFDSSSSSLAINSNQIKLGVQYQLVL